MRFVFRYSFFFQAEDGIRDRNVTGVQTCALPIFDLAKRRLRELRPASARPAQRTGYRPAQVLQLDWAEMPTRPRLADRERRVYADRKSGVEGKGGGGGRGGGS